MRRYLAVFLASCLLLVTIIVPSYAASDQATSRLIVIFEERAQMSQAMEALTRAGLIVESFDILDGFVVHANQRAVMELTKGKGIKSIEVDRIVHALPKPDKPGKPGGEDPPAEPPSSQVIDWGVLAVGAPDAWGHSTGLGVKVAVIDTGIDRNHPDLQVLGGITYMSRGSYDDDNGHGTHVAGIIAAMNNDLGVVGVAYDAELYAVKALNKRGSGYLSDIVRGVEWSIENGMDVINMSLGTNSDYGALADVLTRAEDAGIISVAAAGNDSGAVDFPGAYSSTIAVGAIDASQTLAYFSSHGSEVDVVGPGVAIYSTYKDGAYATMSGTSMSSPHIAGLAVLYKQANPAANLTDFRSALISSSLDLGDQGFDEYYGNGLPDAGSLWN